MNSGISKVLRNINFYNNIAIYWEAKTRDSGSHNGKVRL